MPRVATPNQTVGPFFRIGLAHLYTNDIPGTGSRIAIRGRVLDGDGQPVNDAIIEIWQANAHGEYGAAATADEKGVRGFGRIATDDAGVFRFTTTKPGCVPGPGGAAQAPHLAIAVFMRGLLRHLVTRLYFPDGPGNAEDPILQLVPPGRRATLVAKRTDADATSLEWNIVLQGEDETVFFDY